MTDRFDRGCEVHVYPVPFGMTAEEAFAEIELMGHLVEYRWTAPRRPASPRG